MARRKPEWVTPERQLELANLFSIYGNRCLLGHFACSDITHYINIRSRTVYVSKPMYIPYRDKGGNILKDDNGKPILLTVYKSVKSSELEAEPLRLYELKWREAISNWKSEDKRQWRLERKVMHSLGEYPDTSRSRFNAIGRDIFHSKQPIFYREGLGISVITFHTIAKVRIASSYMRLYVEVDLSKVLRRESKNAKRKAIRYGKKLRHETEVEIDRLCYLAVRHYLKY
jgi:hypothetical protein